MFVRPAEGRTVRRPDTLVHLLAAGEDVPRDEFWIRRLSDGDVVEGVAVNVDGTAPGQVAGHAYEFGRPIAHAHEDAQNALNTAVPKEAPSFEKVAVTDAQSLETRHFYESAPAEETPL